jgi:hypothetical protein
LLGKRNSDLLNFLVGEKPDERFVTEIADLDAVTPRIPEIATEIGLHFELVFFCEFLSYLFDLNGITDHQSKMLHAVRLKFFHFKDRHELMLTQLAPRGAFPAAKHFQAKDVCIEIDSFLCVSNLNDNVITSVNLDGHNPSSFPNRLLKKPASIVLSSQESSTGTRPPHHSAARTDVVLLIRRTVRP